MAVPKRHTSKQKKRSRRGHIKLTVPAMHYDATTGEYRLSHRVSPKGYYKGRQVVSETSTSDNN
ncbi:50S ribosomal protein L32 [Lactobacillus sp. ESL0785]|uniref:50S ribosomal protein L32 n=1 Tax=Lactobacillus sp. ESL0785 TaxID=2983232 RepID=UPI0023F9F3C8|nr:50S ribosomal protein L32 [Lactobacillus sp. ESL0785]WEV71568.1 50S ribosomal protein L32 [Lactobacillus sp. ESL0785]